MGAGITLGRFQRLVLHRAFRRALVVCPGACYRLQDASYCEFGDVPNLRICDGSRAFICRRHSSYRVGRRGALHSKSPASISTTTKVVAFYSSVPPASGLCRKPKRACHDMREMAHPSCRHPRTSRTMSGAADHNFFRADVQPSLPSAPGCKFPIILNCGPSFGTLPFLQQ